MTAGAGLDVRAAAPEATKPRRPLRRDIQGLRALAVVLVVLDHAGVEFFSGGFVGVDVFFVISGFLISGHLVERLGTTGRVDFVGFYAARTRRILPAATVTIIATAAAAFVLVSPLRIRDILSDAIASALYVPNILFAVRETDYLAGTAPSPFQHFWSLGVEEQFYLLWPLALLGAFVLTRGSRRGVLVAIGVIGVVSFAASIVATADAPSVAFFSPHTRAWEFAVGAVIAGIAPTLSRVPSVLAQVLSWTGLGLILVTAAAYSAETGYPGAAALVPVLGAALVVAFGERGARGAVALLRQRPVQFLGAISYSLYLVHWPVLVLAHESIGLGQPLPVGIGVILVIASVPVAWLLYRFVETPFRVGTAARGPGAPDSRSVLAVSAAVVMVLVAALFVTGGAAGRMPLTSDRAEPVVPLSRLPAGTGFVPQNITPGLAAASGDTGAIYTPECQQNLSGSAVLTCGFGVTDSAQTIALFGDSHAGRWFPALDLAAQGLDFRLDTYTKSGCRSEETVAAWGSSANASCSVWRNDVVALLNENPPDVIVLANHLGPRPDRNQAQLETEWTDGLSQLLDRLPASSRVVTLADSPEFDSSPILCLSSHLENADTCAVPRATALNPAIRAAQQAAAAEHGAEVVDLTDYFCNEADCPAVIGPTLVYSDEHHLTASFSLALGPALQQALGPLIGTPR
jgi:peptidoglycan/LPS O-acetylase OafA/YrhL